ncbi:MAG: M48 family metalloprotease [Planctomycetales bacterium]
MIGQRGTTPAVVEDRAGLNDDELRFVIGHEIEHLRTGHPLQQFIQRAVEV